MGKTEPSGSSSARASRSRRRTGSSSSSASRREPIHVQQEEGGTWTAVRPESSAGSEVRGTYDQVLELQEEPTIRPDAAPGLYVNMVPTGSLRATLRAMDAVQELLLLLETIGSADEPIRMVPPFGVLAHLVLEELSMRRAVLARALAGQPLNDPEAGGGS